jgi:hypothetical protein
MKLSNIIFAILILTFCSCKQKEKECMDNEYYVRYSIDGNQYEICGESTANLTASSFFLAENNFEATTSLDSILFLFNCTGKSNVVDRKIHFRFSQNFLKSQVDTTNKRISENLFEELFSLGSKIFVSQNEALIQISYTDDNGRVWISKQETNNSFEIVSHRFVDNKVIVDISFDVRLHNNSDYINLKSVSCRVFFLN